MISSNGSTEQNPQGGEGGDQTNDLDMANGHDRALIRSRRWLISDTKKKEYVEALDQALGIAREKKDQRIMVSCVRTLATLEGQNQEDEHLRHKYQRADEGKPTDIVDHRIYEVEFDRLPAQQQDNDR